MFNTLMTLGFYGLAAALALFLIVSMPVAGFFIVIGAAALIVVCFGDFRNPHTTMIGPLRKDDQR